MAIGKPHKINYQSLTQTEPFMKKLFPVFLLASFIACNNTADNPEAKTDSDQTTLAAAANAGTDAAGCGSLIIFQKGAIIEGKDYDTSGKERSSSITTVKNVRSEGNETIAELSMAIKSTYAGKENNNTLTMAYKCDGKRLAMDLGGFLTNFSALSGVVVEGKALEFPLQLSVGQDLPEASVSADIGKEAGPIKMKTTSSYVKRKVEKKETITTPAGTWSCYKIICNIESTIDAGDSEMGKKMVEMMKAKTPAMSSAMWFAPGFGVVRTEFYKNNRLDSRSEIVSIKK
jgi:hypothetical protein